MVETQSQRITTDREREREREGGVLFNDAELLCYDYITSVVKSKHSEKILTQCHSVNHKSHMDGPGREDCVSPRDPLGWTALSEVHCY
jgi:hypothetical protein